MQKVKCILSFYFFVRSPFYSYLEKHTSRWDLLSARIQSGIWKLLLIHKAQHSVSWWEKKIILRNLAFFIVPLKVSLIYDYHRLFPRARNKLRQVTKWESCSYTKDNSWSPLYHSTQLVENGTGKFLANISETDCKCFSAFLYFFLKHLNTWHYILYMGFDTSLSSISMPSIFYDYV